jgi:hypothetical protein
MTITKTLYRGAPGRHIRFGCINDSSFIVIQTESKTVSMSGFSDEQQQAIFRTVCDCIECMAAEIDGEEAR